MDIETLNKAKILSHHIAPLDSALKLLYLVLATLILATCAMR